MPPRLRSRRAHNVDSLLLSVVATAIPSHHLDRLPLRQQVDSLQSLPGRELIQRVAREPVTNHQNRCRLRDVLRWSGTQCGDSSPGFLARGSNRTREHHRLPAKGMGRIRVHIRFRSCSISATGSGAATKEELKDRWSGDTTGPMRVIPTGGTTKDHYLPASMGGMF